MGCSESTLRRREEQWDWVERLTEYDSGMLQQASDARSKAELELYEEQLARARTVAERAEELLALVECSLKHHLAAGTVLQGRELPLVMARGLQGIGGCHEHRGDGSWSCRSFGRSIDLVLRFRGCYGFNQQMGGKNQKLQH